METCLAPLGHLRNKDLLKTSKISIEWVFKYWEDPAATGPTLKLLVSSSDEEEGDVANDSDSSPPQSRGRGRLEKARAKVGSRGQSEESRSASSQAADEDGSSHVRERRLSSFRRARVSSVDV